VDKNIGAIDHKEKIWYELNSLQMISTFLKALRTSVNFPITALCIKRDLLPVMDPLLFEDDIVDVAMESYNKHLTGWTK